MTPPKTNAPRPDAPKGGPREAAPSPTALAFWLGERLHRIHSISYASAVILWSLAVAFVPGDWSLFWPVMIWTMLYMIHFLIFKSTHVNEEWIEDRVERINDEAKDLSHIEAIRDDYTSPTRHRRPNHDT